MENYITFKKGDNRLLTDEYIKERLEKIGFNKNGNIFQIKKWLRFATNNFEKLVFDENEPFDSFIKEQLSNIGFHGGIELDDFSVV
jgi:hypothetical protein